MRDDNDAGDVSGNLGSSRRPDDEEAGKDGECREFVEEDGSKDGAGEFDLYASGSSGTGGTSEW